MLQLLLPVMLLFAQSRAVAPPPTIPSGWVTEAEGWLLDTIKMNTSSVPVECGYEQEMVDYMTDILDTEGITDYEVIQLPVPWAQGCTTPMLLAHYAGTTSDEILLSGHSDIVSVDTMEDALLGEVVDGFIVGRGSIDMKYKVIYDLATLVWAYRLNLTLERGLMLATFPAEEVLLGAGLAAAMYPQKFANVVVAFEEAHGLTQTVAGQLLMPVGFGEKGICQFLAQVDFQNVHPALYQAMNESAIMRLAQAFISVIGAVLPPQYNDVNVLLLNEFKEISPAFRVIANKLLNPHTYESEITYLRANQPDVAAFLEAQLSYLVSAMRFDASIAWDTTPGHAEGVLGVTALPGPSGPTDNADIIYDLMVDLINDDEVSLEINPFPGATAEATAAFCHGLTVDPTTTEAANAFDQIKSVVETDMNATVVHAHLLALTDCTLLGGLGFPCVNYAPLRMPSDETLLAVAHSPNEHILEASFLEGIRVYFKSMYYVAATAPQ